MEKNQLDEILLESVSKTIESIAFTEILPSDLEMPETEKSYTVSLGVSEPFAGNFQMKISIELLYFFAESMFTIPREEIQEENLLDFSLELLNTIIGSLLNGVLPDDTKFSLDLPKKLAAEAPQTVHWNFSAEETIFSISSSQDMLEYLNNM